MCSQCHAGRLLVPVRWRCLGMTCRQACLRCPSSYQDLCLQSSRCSLLPLTSPDVVTYWLIGGQLSAKPLGYCSQMMAAYFTDSMWRGKPEAMPQYDCRGLCLQRCRLVQRQPGDLPASSAHPASSSWMTPAASSLCQAGTRELWNLHLDDNTTYRYVLRQQRSRQITWTETCHERCT